MIFLVLVETKVIEKFWIVLEHFESLKISW